MEGCQLSSETNPAQAVEATWIKKKDVIKTFRTIHPQKSERNDIKAEKRKILNVSNYGENKD